MWGEITNNSEKEVLEKAKGAIGKKIGIFDTHGRLSNTKSKGRVGLVIEEGLFGLKQNSKPKPDFEELGIELKVTPYKKLSKSRDNAPIYSAKERLVLHVIDYKNDYKYEFYNSNLWEKCHKMLLIFYLYEENILPMNYEITEAFILNLVDDISKEDMEIIKKDWDYLMMMIKEGSAHLISESQTMYLGACTKGINNKSLRKQPFSDQMAMQRAFCLKQSYMTYLIRERFSKKGFERTQSILKENEMNGQYTFEEIVIGKFRPYYGKSQQELITLLGIKSKIGMKSINSLISSAIVGLEDITKSEEFLKANIKLKTIRSDNLDHIIESMSFPAFSFNEIATQKWEDSDLRSEFLEKRYLFVIFKRIKNEFFLDCCGFWSMPVEDLEGDLKDLFEETKRILNTGIQLFNERGVTRNNLPKKKDNRIAHVRPHAARASYTPYNPNADELPDGRWMTKQCFFINNTYIETIVKGILSSNTSKF